MVPEAFDWSAGVKRVTDLETLGLEPGATLPQIKEAWRLLASKHHPDHGGDGQVFNTLRQAYNRAAAATYKPSICDVCKGTAKMKLQRGFSTVDVWCIACSGRGTR